MLRNRTDKTQTDYIEHIATVTAFSHKDGTVTVVVQREDECGECPAARLCGIKDAKGDKIVISDPRPDRFAIGERVIVRGTERLHHKAIMLCTVIPCVLLIVVMSMIYLLTGSQGLAAGCGVGFMMLFFIALYLMRNRIEHEFNFTIQKKGSG